MSEAEKKGSPWPWILVPVAAVTLFFVLRQCRQNLPPTDIAAEAQAISEEFVSPAEAAAQSAPAPVEPAP